MDQNFFINLKQTIGRNRRNSTIPVIRDAFAGWIRAHRKECSEKLLPSVSLLAETLGVARQTIRKVYLSLEELQLISRAKAVLIEYLKLTEPQAHRYIEKQAMDLGLTRRQVALNILKTYES